MITKSKIIFKNKKKWNIKNKTLNLLLIIKKKIHYIYHQKMFLKKNQIIKLIFKKIKNNLIKINQLVQDLMLLINL